MASDDSIFAPYFLDELMEDQVIRCDIDFGTAEFTAFPLAAQPKGSPSHESDSGCSDMSDVRSVSPSDCEESGNTLVDFDFQFEHDLDLELESYLGTPSVVSASVIDLVESSSPPVAQSPVSPPTRPTVLAIPPASPVSSEISVDDESDPDYRPKRILKSKAVVHTKNKPAQIPETNDMDMRVLPSSSTSSLGQMSTKSKLPAIKVVKVIKTQQTSQKGIEDELFQALDQRNRKNAVQAKINREKKKAYIGNLENELSAVQTENDQLKASNAKILKEKNALKDEVEYLKSVLANQSALAGLLQNIGSVQNVKLSSSLTKKRSADLDHDYENRSAKRVRSTTGRTGGVCLHVDDGNVSLEFCSQCAKMASSSSTGDECS